VEGRVGHDQRRLERKRADEVGHGPGQRGHRNAVDLDDLVGVERSGVHVQRVSTSSAGSSVPRHVHAGERDVPEGEPVQDGGRGVTDDGVARHAADRRQHGEGVPGGSVVEPRVVRRDVGAAADDGQPPLLPQTPQFVVGDPGGPQIGPEGQFGDVVEHAISVPPRRSAERVIVAPVDGCDRLGTARRRA
jgi:hypothetical protein